MKKCFDCYPNSKPKNPILIFLDWTQVLIRIFLFTKSRLHKLYCVI